MCDLCLQGQNKTAGTRWSHISHFESCSISTHWWQKGNICGTENSIWGDWIFLCITSLQLNQWGRAKGQEQLSVESHTTASEERHHQIHLQQFPALAPSEQDLSQNRRWAGFMQPLTFSSEAGQPVCVREKTQGTNCCTSLSSLLWVHGNNSRWLGWVYQHFHQLRSSLIWTVQRLR